MSYDLQVCDSVGDAIGGIVYALRRGVVAGSALGHPLADGRSREPS